MPDFNRWAIDCGDAKLRLNYQITPQDVILDCGAYHGTWSRQIYDLYHCKIIAFEPIKAYYDDVVQTLTDTSATIYHAGIGPANTFCDISVQGDASSIMTHLGRQERIQIKSIDDVVRECSLSRIRLMKINIEGAEYDLLDYMLNTDMVCRIDDIQVQFHQFVADSEKRREAIRSRLIQTHHLTYDYEFIWENWHISNTSH